MNDVTWTVYTHVSPHGKKYVGITRQKPEARWRNGDGYRRNRHFCRAITKYGWDNFQHLIIADGINETEAKEMEKSLIARLDLMNTANGYNQTLGGDGASGNRHTLSAETKAKMSKAKMGAGNCNYGKRFSDNHRAKLRDAKIGRYDGAKNPSAKAVMCTTTGETFNTTIEAGIYAGCCRSNISYCCGGKTKTAGRHPITGIKLSWAYANT